MFKGTTKKCDLSENNVNVASGPKVQNCFFNTIRTVSLDIIKPWPVTCPSTLESLQKLESEVNSDINSKVSLCQGDITKLNVNAIVNSVNKTLIGEGGIDRAIHKAAWPGLIGQCYKLNGCKTGECKVTLDYKLPAKYVFHAVRLRDKNEYKLNNFYKTCLEKTLSYIVKSIAFCCRAIDIPGFDPREAAKMALATVRFWLESNHSSIDRVISCTFENTHYEICKDLMSNVVKENSNTDCVVNVKRAEISNKLGQSLPGLQIYPSFPQNSESESFAGRSN